MKTNSAYYRRRALEEVTSAASASHPNAREAHLELARRYGRLAAGEEVGTAGS